MTSKVKVARSCDVSDRCWPISREQNVLETPKLVGRLSTARAIMHTSFKVKGKGQHHQADIMLRPEVRHIFRTARSKIKIAMSCGAPDRCWPISLEQKVPETSKLISNYTSSNVQQFQGQKVKLDYC